MARGLLATMTSVPLVFLVFASTLLLWGAFVSVGAASQPAVMSQYLALPPIHSAIDLDFLVTAARAGGGGGAALAAFLILLVFRAFFAITAISLAADSHLRVRSSGTVGNALSLLRGKMVPLFAIEAVFLLVAVASLFLLVGFLGLLGVVLPLVAALYIGVFVEPVAVLEDLRPREALRASFEVTKLLRSGHSVMVSAYILLIIVLWIVAPGRSGVATPTVAVWVYALVGGLLNVAFLSAFVHRWLLLRPLVLENADGERPDRAAGDEAEEPAERR
jgi:hypothetical protein